MNDYTTPVVSGVLGLSTFAAGFIATRATSRSERRRNDTERERTAIDGYRDLVASVTGDLARVTAERDAAEERVALLEQQIVDKDKEIARLKRAGRGASR